MVPTWTSTWESLAAKARETTAAMPNSYGPRNSQYAPMILFEGCGTTRKGGSERHSARGAAKTPPRCIEARRNGGTQFSFTAPSDDYLQPHHAMREYGSCEVSERPKSLAHVFRLFSYRSVSSWVRDTESLCFCRIGGLLPYRRV